MSYVTSAQMLLDAQKGGYAVGAFNAENMEMVKAIIAAAEELHAPVMIQTTGGTIKYGKEMTYAGIVRAEAKSAGVPVCLHLDHGPSMEMAVRCLRAGYSSVMIDGSKLPFEENIAESKKVAEYAHERGVVVEAELGTLAGVEDEVSVEAGKESYTHPDEVEEFVTRTGCDSLAIAIGTSHGAYKFTPAQCTRNADGVLVPPPLRFDVLKECIKRLPGFPIVLHGSSSVPQEFVKMVNTYGGHMPDAIGIPEDQLREAAKLAVCKINIDSDIRLAMTGNIRKYFAEHPDHFDPRQYLKPARQAVKDMVAHKILYVLGSDGKA